MAGEKKIKVAVLFGGKSAEHEVSVQSAKNVYNSLDRKKYDVVLIGIDKKGIWHTCDDKYFLESSFDKPLILNRNNDVVQVAQGGKGLLKLSSSDEHIDVVFPVLHGTYGEDGSVQGLLKLADIPFVGPGILGSAVGMDKDVAKRLFRDAGLPVGKFLVLMKGDKYSFSNIKKELGLPFFVKPANLGSSIGISKVKNEKDFDKAIKYAFEFDTKIIIEEFIDGREIECSVLGNDDPIASVPGEIVASHEFYDYDAKYFDAQGAELKIPAKLPVKNVKEVQTLAVKAFKVLCLEGMARVDFFLSKPGKFYVNEVNTIPGFTNISMYPKLWEASGIGYSELIDRLIGLAIERHIQQKQLKTSI